MLILCQTFRQCDMLHLQFRRRKYTIWYKVCKAKLIIIMSWHIAKACYKAIAIWYWKNIIRWNCCGYWWPSSSDLVQVWCDLNIPAGIPGLYPALGRPSVGALCSRCEHLSSLTMRVLLVLHLVLLFAAIGYAFRITEFFQSFLDSGNQNVERQATDFSDKIVPVFTIAFFASLVNSLFTTTQGLVR